MTRRIYGRSSTNSPMPLGEGGGARTIKLPSASLPGMRIELTACLRNGPLAIFRALAAESGRRILLASSRLVTPPLN